MYVVCVQELVIIQTERGKKRGRMGKGEGGEDCILLANSEETVRSVEDVYATRRSWRRHWNCWLLQQDSAEAIVGRRWCESIHSRGEVDGAPVVRSPPFHTPLVHVCTHPHRDTERRDIKQQAGG